MDDFTEKEKLTIKNLIAYGFPIEEVAPTMGMSPEDFSDKLKNDLVLCQQIRLMILRNDEKVINSLFIKATGGKKRKKVVKENYVFKVNEATGKVEKTKLGEEVTKTEEDTEPSESAIKYWLNNKRPEMFTDLNSLDKMIEKLSEQELKRLAYDRKEKAETQEETPVEETHSL